MAGGLGDGRAERLLLYATRMDSDPPEHERSEEREVSKHTVWRVSAVFLVVVALWLLTPIVTSKIVAGLDANTMAMRGQLGDLFGSINALFSGLAFAGVVIAIWLQREELKLQREELRLQRLEVAANREELARAATAQEESREALRRTIYAHGFKAAMDVLQDDPVRAARGFVLEHLKGTDYRMWDDTSRRHAERVCQTYDSVGIMVKNGMIPVEYIADSWGDSLRRTWAILRPLVEDYRRKRNSGEYWDDYEYLAREAERFQKLL